jgi:hypothetical protein
MGSLNIAFLRRKITNGGGGYRVVPACLREAGHHVLGVYDEDVAGWQDLDLLWIEGHANRFPGACRQLERMGAKRPRVVIC